MSTNRCETSEIAKRVVHSIYDYAVVMYVKFIGMSSAIEGLLPFDCLNLNYFFDPQP